MPELPYMPFYINDYLGDTQGLTAEQHGAYLLIIFHYWMNGKPIADDDEELALVARMSNEKWTSVRTKIQRFFQRENNEWRHERIEKELQKARNLIAQRQKAGKASADKRKTVIRANERCNEKDTSVDLRASDSDSVFSSEVNTSQVENAAATDPPKPEPLFSPKLVDETWSKIRVAAMEAGVHASDKEWDDLWFYRVKSWDLEKKLQAHACLVRRKASGQYGGRYSPSARKFFEDELFTAPDRVMAEPLTREELKREKLFGGLRK